MPAMSLLLTLAVAALSTARGAPSLAVTAASSHSAAQPCNEADNRIIGTGSIANITNIATAAACCAECNSNPECVAYTWVKPSTKATSNHCFLKANRMDNGEDSAVTSGACLPLPPPPPGPCKPPPTTPYPAVAALPRCSDFPDPFLQSDGTRVANAAEWEEHKRDLKVRHRAHVSFEHRPRSKGERCTGRSSARLPARA